MELKDLLGGKGANLAEMTSVLAAPRPPGFTISTDACRAYMAGGWPEGLDAEVAGARTRLEKAMGKTIGDADDPLLVSVRSGAKFSMPGMMDTVLNLGLNDRSVEGLAKQTGDERFAFDSYRRFIAMYGRIVLDLPGEEFDSLFDAAKELAGTTSDAKVPDRAAALPGRLLPADRRAPHRQPFPQDPADQLRGAIEAVFRSWNGPRAIAYRNRERISHDLGTAVNVQAMVFGNRDDNSGTGVGFTRDPATGAKGAYGDFLVNAQGEDVVAGIRNTEPISELKKQFPKVHAELTRDLRPARGHYRDMCDTEFTIDQGKLWMLQTRVGQAHRHGRPQDGGRHGAPERPRDLQGRGRVADHRGPPRLGAAPPVRRARATRAWAKGLGACPGAAVGRIYFTADDAAAAAERGEQVILVRSETSPEDVHGMLAAEGILTARGGLVSHAAVVARGWGKPAVVGAEVLRLGDRGDGRRRHPRTRATGSRSTAAPASSWPGEVPLTAAEPPPAFDTVLSWADAIRAGHLAVRANADTGEDAANARSLGAEGIGLCRTEHMFLGEDRLPVVRRMILADRPDEEAAALEELRQVQREDFIEHPRRHGRPAGDRASARPAPARVPALHRGAGDQGGHRRATPRSAGSTRPRCRGKRPTRCSGTRGVRLGVVKPGLYAMQVRALMEAARQRVVDGGHPIVEIMIPLTVSREELALARSWVEEAVAEVTRSRRPSPSKGAKAPRPGGASSR